ncbi:MAG TPA: ABC transporter permease [Acidobacteriaceae bacterium]|nr:ABC transporter permease [Acidobacteriaceae bacterium]
MRLQDSKEAVRMAMETLRTNRLRSGLTILGIVIGITTVIAISSFINGLNRNIDTMVEAYGTNLIWVYHIPVIGVRLSREMLERRKLTYDDAMAMKNLPHVVAVDPGIRYEDFSLNIGNVSVKYKDRKIQHTIIQGNTGEMRRTNDLDLKSGRLYTDYEEEHNSNVVVLGYDAADQLFQNEDPIGKEVQVYGDVFTVIGVLDKQKSAFGGGKNPEDNIAMFPLGTFHKIHPEQKNVWITVKYDDAKNKGLVVDEIEQLLRIRRKVPVDKPDDFEIFGPDSITRLWNEITGGLFIFMFAVSSVGLIVGGVGVMNIMLVSVTERTREIGVRKAIGATKRNILMQFTLEAITLCAVGGVLGIAVGAVLTFILRLAISTIQTSLSGAWVLAAFIISCLIGLVFGIYPAWKAANLDPIEALRYE